MPSIQKTPSAALFLLLSALCSALVLSSCNLSFGPSYRTMLESDLSTLYTFYAEAADAASADEAAADSADGTASESESAAAETASPAYRLFKIGSVVDFVNLAIPELTKENHRIVGWYYLKNAEDDSPELPETFAVDEDNVLTTGIVTPDAACLYAKWKLIVQSAYTVQHYQQNLSDDDYTLFESESLSGEAETDTAAASKDYEGFTAQPFDQEPILADGSTVVKIYYTRNLYTYTFNLDGGTSASVSDGGTLTGKYGAVLDVAEPEKDSCVFKEWSPELPATFGADDAEDGAIFTALYKRDVSTAITVTVTESELSITSSVAGTSVTLSVPSDYENVSWLIDDTAASAFADATVSADGRTLTLTALSDNFVYQVSVNAQKDGILYSAQAQVDRR